MNSGIAISTLVPIVNEKLELLEQITLECETLNFAHEVVVIERKADAFVTVSRFL